MEEKLKENPLISVIIPVYNAEQYLERCLKSVLSQTYINLEILLINDGSTDASQIICDKFAEKDERIRIIQKDNSGVAETRNVGILEARGEYIGFVDSDDYIKQDMFEKMLMQAKKSNSDIVMCGYYVDNSEKIQKVSMNYENRYEGYSNIVHGLLKLYYGEYCNGLYSLCNKLIKRTVYFQNNIMFDVSLKRGEDAWFIFQCLKNSNRVDVIREPLYFYYQNNQSIMHTLYEDQYEKWVYMRKLLLKENESLGIPINFQLFYKDFLYKIVVYCRELCKAHKNEKIFEIIQDKFYLNALKYEKGFPIHIKMIHYFIKKKRTKTVLILYKLWSMKEK